MLLRVNSLKKSFQDNLLFEDVSFFVDEADKIGFIGANGSGKSTLFKILLDKQTKDSGEIYKSRNLKIAYLEQHACATSDKSVYDEVLSVFEKQKEIEEELNKINKLLQKGEDSALIEREAKLWEVYKEIDGFTYKNRTKAALLGMGFSEEDFSLSVSRLSGGQKTRIALLKVLMSECDLLLLDEPTNHLDIESINFLEKYIKDSKKAFIIISHDRYFLENVTNKTFLLENTEFYSHNLSYSDFQDQLSIERLTQKRNYENTMREINRLNRIIEQQKRWNREKNIKTANSKQKIVDKLKLTLGKKAPETKQIAFNIQTTSQGSDDVLKCQNVCKCFGEKEVINNFNLHIKRHERVFLLGPNGCGKTTILKLIQNIYQKDSGEIEIGKNVKIGYFDQMQERLSDEKTVLDEVWDEFSGMGETKIRNTLASFSFFQDDVKKKIKELSGGEKARVQMAKLVLKDINLLLLDEPTNHLDIASREALETALSDFSGTIFAVSHDRYFINRLATRIVEIQDDEVINYDGDYDYYMEKRSDFKKEENETINKSGSNDYLKQKQIAAANRKKEKDLKRTEEKISKLEEKIKLNTDLLFTQEIAKDYVKAQQINEENEELELELEKLYEFWQELTE